MRALRRRLRPRGRPLIESYDGYATPDALILRGRVLSTLRRADPRPGQGRWANLLQMASLFLTDEVADVPVRCGEATARSDDEGYFTLAAPLPGAAARNAGPAAHADPAPRDGALWVRRAVRIDAPDGDEAEAAALRPAPDAPFMVISDIDDTVLRTGAHSLLRNLWTSLTGNALTREVFTDAVALLNVAASRRAPIYFVSSSPWNLHHFLETLFERHGVPRGPMFLRDLGFRLADLGAEGHERRKGASIETLLDANPGLGAVLMGDTGQHDAEIYAEAAERRPGRVVAVALRQAGLRRGRGGARCDGAIARLRAAGIPTQVAGSFEGAADLLPAARSPEAPEGG